MRPLTSSTRISATAAVVLISGAALLVAMPARADIVERVKAGEIVSASIPQGKGVWPGQAIALIEGPADLVQSVIASFDRYREFMPRVTGSRRVKDDRFVVDVDLPWPLQKTWAYLQASQGDQQGVRFVKWKMINGTLKSYEGVAWIQPWGKSRCMLTLRMLAVPQTAAPDGMLNDGMRKAAATMAKAVRRRVAEAMVQGGATSDSRTARTGAAESASTM